MAEAKKRQRFFDVEIPLLNRETQLYGYDLENFKDKYVIYDLTRILKGKNVLMKFKVDLVTTSAASSSAGGMKAVADPVEFVVLPYYIRRMMRKGVNYVENSFVLECEDAIVRIKPFLITRKKVSRGIRKALREKTKEELTTYLKNKNSKEVFEELLKNKIQKNLSLTLKKIYPLSLCEIKFFKIEKELSKK